MMILAKVVSAESSLSPSRDGAARMRHVFGATHTPMLGPLAHDEGDRECEECLLTPSGRSRRAAAVFGVRARLPLPAHLPAQIGSTGLNDVCLRVFNVSPQLRVLKHT